ncbi:Actin-binding Rho-activating protein [Armadillidium vulgare]|nr:Actin-binding Rho-activating protein [Armadillidium vulgare]
MKYYLFLLPLPGSKSEARAEAAQYHVMMDIKYLCEMIFDCAEWRSPDGRAAMTFGKLFNLYNAVSDKVVGTLLRARKHGFVHFDGEMLYQRRDEDKVIELTRNMNTIRKRFGLAPLVTGGGEIEPWNSENADDIPYHMLKERRKTASVINVTKKHLNKSEKRKTSLEYECQGDLCQGEFRQGDLCKGSLTDIPKKEDEDVIDEVPET